MAEENKIPELEKMSEEEMAQGQNEEFNHDEHMLKVQEGLKQILASNDIEEIKAIAQSLLEEENKEAEIKGQGEDVSMADYLGGR